MKRLGSYLNTVKEDERIRPWESGYMVVSFIKLWGRKRPVVLVYITAFKVLIGHSGRRDREQMIPELEI